MKVVFVVDELNSALHTSASQWCKSIGGEIYSASHFRSLKHLLVELISQKPELVIFSWRQVLDLAFLSRRNLRLLTLLQSQSRVLALVADHSGDDPARLAKDFRLYEKNIGLVTVTQRLYDFYSGCGIVPVGKLPDRPNCDLIREVRAESIQRCLNSLIWIGNSGWGKRQGYKDHKGLHSKFRPFFDRVIELQPDIKGTVIDSAVQKISQREVLRKLAKSEVLIVTSAAEGTGLPILEALGVGTNVISTNVGIAQDLSTVRVLPVDASPDNFLEAYINWRCQKFSPEASILDFERYMSLVDESWEELILNANLHTFEGITNSSTLERVHLRIFELLFWNLKFLLRWKWVVGEK